MVEVLRTPDERFQGLPDWSYQPAYVEIDDEAGGQIDDQLGGMRLARVDEGPRGAHPVVLVHGEPTWGFLWRTVIPPLLDAGLRAVAVDQVGFGRSDKPVARDWYTYDRLVASFGAHIEAIGFDQPITLVVHDWGGVVGLRWAVENPDEVARLVLHNTGLWASGGGHSEDWMQFREFIENADEGLPFRLLINGGTATDLDDSVLAAYEAPFPSPDYEAGAVALPLLVPVADDDPGAAAMTNARNKLSGWDKPTAVLWGAEDPILPLKVAQRFADDIPGAGEVDTVAGMHFLQEDAGEEVGRRIAAFVTR